MNLLRLSLHLGLHVPCDPAEALFDLAADVLGSPRYAMFVHWQPHFVGLFVAIGVWLLLISFPHPPKPT